MVRADAQRNIDALLEAAMTVFTTSGVDAPAKQIADLAGVGVGTVYRHFPQRSDLVVAVLRHEIDACAESARASTLDEWFGGYVALLRTKPGFASALHSGDPAFAALPGYFMQTLGPALSSLLDAAAAAGEIRAGTDAEELLYAVALLCQGKSPERMVALLVDGLRYRAGAP